MPLKTGNDVHEGEGARSAPLVRLYMPVYEIVRAALPEFLGSLGAALALGLLASLRVRLRRTLTRCRRALAAARTAWRDTQPDDQAGI